MKILRAVLLLACSTLHGQSAENATKQVSIPFVGCSSSGQLEESKAPKGRSKSVSIGEQDGRALAFYESADGISVLAPRGWYCQGVSGSSGVALFLGPASIVHDSSGWHGLDGAVMEVSDISGEASGRYQIAEVIARVFPAYRRSALGSLQDFDAPIPAGPYPKDTLKYLSHTAVEYRTPAQTEGLGNVDSWIGKTSLPITGVAILLMKPPYPGSTAPHLIRLSIRLPRNLAWLAPTIIRYLERNPVSTIETERRQ